MAIGTISHPDRSFPGGIGFKTVLAAFLAVMVLLCPAHAYVLPPGQLVEFMTANFSGFRTLAVSQAVYMEKTGTSGAEPVFRERLWLKAPGSYCVEALDPPSGPPAEGAGLPPGPPCGDPGFFRLFLANGAEEILSSLSRMGVNIEASAFTRVEGAVAYRIGDGGPGCSVLLIGDDSFLPLLLRYPVSTVSGREMMTVRFRQYRKAGKGWYPYEITCRAGDHPEARIRVEDLRVNPPVGRPLSIIPEAGVRPVTGPPSEDLSSPGEREVRDVIRALKEKYRGVSH